MLSHITLSNTSREMSATAHAHCHITSSNNLREMSAAAHAHSHITLSNTSREMSATAHMPIMKKSIFTLYIIGTFMHC